VYNQTCISPTLVFLPEQHYTEQVFRHVIHVYLYTTFVALTQPMTILHETNDTLKCPLGVYQKKKKQTKLGQEHFKK
jgi:ribosome-associated toxin RatA of RatAB toxin-antitoxin module